MVHLITLSQAKEVIQNALVIGLERKKELHKIFNLTCRRFILTSPAHHCPPVYAGLGVSDLVETGDLEAVGVASLALVHEVAKGQHHFQDLNHPLAPNHLLGCIQDG